MGDIDRGSSDYYNATEVQALMNQKGIPRSVRSNLNTSLTQNEIGGGASARKILNSKIINMLEWTTEKAYGGPVKKRRGNYMGGGKVHRKMYAKGGGIRKAKRYG
jgi:hypothetical protein